MNRPNDRLNRALPAQGADADPRIYLVVNNEKFLRPGLETFFAAPAPGATITTETVGGCACNAVEGLYCTCNKVCACNPQCSCQGHTTCSCVGHTSSGGGTYCSCVPVH